MKVKVGAARTAYRREKKSISPPCMVCCVCGKKKNAKQKRERGMRGDYSMRTSRHEKRGKPTRPTRPLTMLTNCLCFQERNCYDFWEDESRRFTFFAGEMTEILA